MPLDLNALVRTWQAGDRRAADSALEQIRAGVLRYLLARRLPLHEAEDTVQDVCLAVVAAAPAWEDRGRPFWALVFTITRRRLADRSRAAGRVTTPESLPEALEAAALPLPDPEDVLLAQERAADVGALLRQLPDTQREVVVLRTLVGLSVAETAAALGLAHGSVHVLHHRAMRRLREALGRA